MKISVITGVLFVVATACCLAGLAASSVAFYAAGVLFELGMWMSVLFRD